MRLFGPCFVAQFAHTCVGLAARMAGDQEFARLTRIGSLTNTDRGSKNGRARESGSGFADYVLLRALEGYSLTGAEQAVALEILNEGASNARISQYREVAEDTVKTQARCVFRAATVANRSEFAAAVLRRILHLVEHDEEVRSRLRRNG